MAGSQKVVVIEELKEREDGRLQMTVILGPKTSTDVKEAAGDKLERMLTAAVRKAVVTMAGQTGRIVAPAPRALAEAFEAYCRNQGVSKSRALLGRISRYVSEDGEILGKRYPSEPALPPVEERTDREKKKIIQVFAPAEQVYGFDQFCKKVGIQKDTFMMREILRLINPSSHVKKGQGVDAGGA